MSEIEKIQRKRIGEKIKNLRKYWGLSLQQVAKKSGSSKSYIWEVENKNINLTSRKLVAIANALQTTPNFLLDDTKEKMTLSDEEDRFFRKYKILNTEDRRKIEQIIDVFVQKERS